MMLILYLTLVLTARTAISTNFTHIASDSNGECHCFSNITIQIESPKESQCLLAEQLILENERLKRSNDSEEAPRECGLDNHYTLNCIYVVLTRVPVVVVSFIAGLFNSASIQVVVFTILIDRVKLTNTFINH